MSIIAQLPTSLGGGEGKVAIIDTEGTYRPDRVAQIAERFEVDPDAALENILYARAMNSEHQLELLNGLAREFASGEYKLLVIDSILNCFRVDFSGRGELSERQQKLNQFLTKLAHMAEEFNICVLMVTWPNPILLIIMLRLHRPTRSSLTLVRLHFLLEPMAASPLVDTFSRMLQLPAFSSEREEAMKELQRLSILLIAQKLKQPISLAMAASKIQRNSEFHHARA